MILVLTSSRYWYRRYLIARRLTEEEAIYVDDSWMMQKYPRDTKVILTNGSNRLDVYTINKARAMFDDVQRDFVGGEE